MKLERFENRLKHKRELFDLREKYKIDETEKKKIQYSKILTSILMAVTLAFNIFFNFYIVPHSGVLGMTDSAFSTMSNVLTDWNKYTIGYFVVFLAKSLFETKWEKEGEQLPIGDIVNDIKDKVQDIIK